MVTPNDVLRFFLELAADVRAGSASRAQGEPVIPLGTADTILTEGQ
jgi:hypothetical protein